MGAAKKRGSYEVRKAEGEVKRIAEEQARIRKHVEYEASLTPEDKEKRHKTRLMMATMAGLTAGTMI